MPRNSLSSLVLALLACATAACEVSVSLGSPEVEDASTGINDTRPSEGTGAGAESAASEDEASTALDSSSSGEPADHAADEDTSGTGDSEEAATSTGAGTGLDSTGSLPDGDSSTGAPVPLAENGAECVQGEECESGLCGLGACLAATAAPCADAPDQCENGFECLTFVEGSACVATGADTQGGEVAVNESPMGEIDLSDIDMWEIADLGTGSYIVKIKADAGGELYILAPNGAVLSEPSLATTDGGDFVSYEVKLDAPLPFITVAVRGKFPGNHPYYFYTLIE